MAWVALSALFMGALPVACKTGNGRVNGGRTVAMDKCNGHSTNKGGILGPATPWRGPPLNEIPPRFTAGMVGSVNAWVPAQYAEAEDGKVGILFGDPAITGGTPEISPFARHVETLMAAGLMPPIFIVPGGGVDW